MRLVAYFEDREGMMAHRAKYEPDHIEYLRQHQDKIPIAGGLRPEPGGVFVGGMWVMEVDSFAEAEALIQNDPYYAPELRSYKLNVWGKAIEGDVVL
ncbi:MAG: YciI family protein [Pseudomonadales bacterium]